MLQQVERREYNSKVPSWITKLIKSREQKSPPLNDYGDRYNRGGSGGGGNGGRSGDLKRRSFNNKNDSERSVRVNNSNQHDTCKLRSNESYKDIFHPGNTCRLTKPKKKNGDINCLRFHTAGYCFKECKFSHGILDAEEAAEHAAFVQSAREQRKSHQERRNRNNAQHERPGPSQANTSNAIPTVTGE